MRVKREKLQNEISLIRATKVESLGFDTKNIERKVWALTLRILKGTT